MLLTIRHVNHIYGSNIKDKGFFIKQQFVLLMKIQIEFTLQWPPLLLTLYHTFNSLGQLISIIAWILQFSYTYNPYKV